MQSINVTHQAAKVVANVQSAIVCRRGCDVSSPNGEVIQQVGWEQARLTTHMRSWTKVHVDALPLDVNRIEIELFCAGGRRHTYILTR